jgi:hypothetical protein
LFTAWEAQVFKLRFGLAVIGATFLASLADPALGAGSSRLQVVDFTEYACPAGIATPSDLEAAGGPDQACAVAGKVGEFSWKPEGYTWYIDPIEFDLQASLRPRAHGRSFYDPQPMAGGSCNPNTMQCRAFQAYGWSNVPTGSATVTEITVPPGYTFGWANVFVNGVPWSATYDVSTRSVTFTTTRADDGASVYVQLINATS